MAKKNPRKPEKKPPVQHPPPPDPTHREPLPPVPPPDPPVPLPPLDRKSDVDQRIFRSGRARAETRNCIPEPSLASTTTPVPSSPKTYMCSASLPASTGGPQGF
jgi:hypothetical protein